MPASAPHTLAVVLFDGVVIGDFGPLCDLFSRVRTADGRRFHEQTGTTPADWLLTARIRRGQHLLETTDQSIERVAGACGFGAGSSFRERFRSVTGTSPSAYRQTFGHSGIRQV